MALYKSYKVINYNNTEKRLYWIAQHFKPNMFKQERDVVTADILRQFQERGSPPKKKELSIGGDIHSLPNYFAEYGEVTKKSYKTNNSGITHLAILGGRHV